MQKLFSRCACLPNGLVCHKGGSLLKRNLILPSHISESSFASQIPTCHSLWKRALLSNWTCPSNGEEEKENGSAYTSVDSNTCSGAFLLGQDWLGKPAVCKLYILKCSWEDYKGWSVLVTDYAQHHVYSYLMIKMFISVLNELKLLLKIKKKMWLANFIA